MMLRNLNERCLYIEPIFDTGPTLDEPLSRYVVVIQDEPLGFKALSSPLCLHLLHYSGESDSL